MEIDPLFCHHCGRELHPGTGDFYVVNIETFADPNPPIITEEDLARDSTAEIKRLSADLENLSPQEAMDQVYRRITFNLCAECYRPWIENPVPS